MRSDKFQKKIINKQNVLFCGNRKLTFKPDTCKVTENNRTGCCIMEILYKPYLYGMSNYVKLLVISKQIVLFCEYRQLTFKPAYIEALSSALNISGYTMLGVSPSGSSTNISCLHVTCDRASYNYSKVQFTMVEALDSCRLRSKAVFPAPRPLQTVNRTLHAKTHEIWTSLSPRDIIHEKTIEDKNYDKDNIYVPSSQKA
ncbi:hypothetical protein AGLY_017866 [Aphis glycines]|uniref:Uncharacterized protein n=1 Tax=Aphis glycines TaxID=307491 RepID=A0A6G0SUA3_APHGL|nr:hypothetical protein AGLY_017866 [Aphis glycines]